MMDAPIEIVGVKPHVQEKVLNPHTIGQIVHQAYGIDVNGSAVPATTLDQLHTHGFEDKEILGSLKAGLFSDTMIDLAQRMEGTTFIPVKERFASYAGDVEYDFASAADLTDTDGSLDYGRLNLYLRGLIGKRANEIFRGNYRVHHPNAYSILDKIADGPERNGEVDVLFALDFGLMPILGMHNYLSKRVSPEIVGKAMERSMPILYKLASHNTEGKGSPELVEKSLVPGENPEKINKLRHVVQTQLQDIPPIQRNALRQNIFSELAHTLEILGLNSPEYTQALATIESSLADQEKFTAFISGLDVGDIGINNDNWEVQEFFRFQQKNIFYDIGKFYNEKMTPQVHYPIPHDLKVALADLELESRVDLLNEEYYDFTTMPDGVPVLKLKDAVDTDASRAEKSLLLREPVDGPTFGERIPADLVVPQSKTVRCSALYSRLPKEALERIQPVMDATNFHPESINGIAFTTLLTLNAAQQALKTAEGKISNPIS